jgi:hypothetical protein
VKTAADWPRGAHAPRVCPTALSHKFLARTVAGKKFPDSAARSAATREFTINSPNAPPRCGDLGLRRQSGATTAPSDDSFARNSGRSRERASVTQLNSTNQSLRVPPHSWRLCVDSHPRTMPIQFPQLPIPRPLSVFVLGEGSSFPCRGFLWRNFDRLPDWRIRNKGRNPAKMHSYETRYTIRRMHYRHRPISSDLILMSIWF